MTPPNVLLVFAVLCGCAGAWKGNRVAMALLASTAFTSLLIWAGVAFNIALWLLIDGLVIAVIASQPLRWTDTLVMGLFIPSWVFYVVPDPIGPDVSTVAVSAQLMLTTPAGLAGRAVGRFCARWKDNLRNRSEWTDLEKAHG